MYHCQNPSCAISISKATFPVAMNCPVCQNPLIEVQEISKLTEADELLLEKLPYVISYPLQQALLEPHAWTRINLLKDTFLNYLKYLGLLTASEFFNSPFKERKIVDLFQQNLAQPSFGNWNAFTRECLLYLKTQNHHFFCSELATYYETVETSKKRKLYTGEIEFVDNYGDTQLKKQEATAIGMLINFRNRYLGHGLTLDTITSEKLWNEYFPIFRTLLEQLTFAKKYPMLKHEASKYYSLQGLDIKSFETSVTIDANVSVYNIENHTYMPIIPFFIIPGELAIDKEEKPNIFSYESYTGKTIKFFSPEGIEKQTSGKILERLNLLLREKQKEIPFTPDTFTKAIFLERIAEENELMLKSLLTEKKIIEGIYQHREEMEIKLREWIGARANIFFIAAEAGSGKTNILVEMQKQYRERGLASLFIRASRMEKPSLKDELAYQLNMDTSIELSHYTALAGTQAEPTFILIDGLNESSHAESIWQEILEISTLFEPGSLKFIVTNRANSKSDLGRYAVSEQHIQYLYGENKDHLQGLAGFVFWLTPMDMKEMEGAWNTYSTEDKNRFKPLFSFNDIATFDRGLYLQLNNPLVLRIFLETYKGKNLPKKGAKHLHVWKDWFATFTLEEQTFMHLLATAVWEQGENKLLLDTVLHHEKLQPYFLNDSISAPYLRLLSMGWLSRYTEDFTLYISFTVEGVLLYLLGTKLNQQNPALTSEAIDSILTNGTKLKKAAIESFLCEQSLEGKMDLIAQLIDEGEEKLDLCVTPLLYFLKFQGVEKTIEKLLENPTENDWDVLIKVEKKLTELQFFVIRNEFFVKLSTKLDFTIKKSILIGLKSVIVLKNENQFSSLKKNKLINNLIINEDDELLEEIGKCEFIFNNNNKSLIYFKKCLKIRIAKLGQFHNDVGTIFSDIGGVYYKKKDYQRSLCFALKSNDIAMIVLGKNHPHFAITNANIGMIFARKGDFEKSLEYNHKCLSILLNQLGDEHLYVSNSYFCFGFIYKNKGELIKSLDYYHKGTLIRINLLGENHPLVAESFLDIAYCYNSLFDYLNTLKYLIQGFNISKSGKIAFQIAQCYEALNELEKALDYYVQSAEIRKEDIGIDDEATREAIANAKRLAKELGKEGELSR